MMGLRGEGWGWEVRSIKVTGNTLIQLMGLVLILYIYNLTINNLVSHN